MKPSKLAETIASMQGFRPDSDYYTLTLLATEEGELLWNIQTNFAGYTEDSPPKEIRKASLIYPDRMISIWRDFRQPYVVVHTPGDLSLFMLIGGNALIEKNLAEERLPDLYKEIPVIQTGFVGFLPADSAPKQIFHRAPSPKLRMKVLKRDGYRCKICGRRPTDYTDIELHVHHIRPWSRGGVSHEENLITLCHTCHMGLDPHEEIALFCLVDPDRPHFGWKDSRDDFWPGVKRYREKTFQIYRDVVRAKVCHSAPAPDNSGKGREH